MPVLFEQLKITHKDSDIKLGQIRKSLAEILSKPVALDLQNFYTWENTMFRIVQCSVNYHCIRKGKMNKQRHIQTFFATRC